MKLLHIVGARPNLMKAAPVLAAISARLGWKQVLVHTGQHYDANMSGVFFEQLELPVPDVNLEVGSGPHAVQTGQVMIKLEPLLTSKRPDMVLVYGDVNSTVAAALVCAKLGIRLAHVEAGLRSFDRSMPEEINRMVTDRLADLLFTPSQDGDENLLREGVAKEQIFFVGNVMIDTLVRLLPLARASWDEVPRVLGIARDDWHQGAFALCTLHRPANVDDIRTLERLVRVLGQIGERLPVIFPVHPRTRRQMQRMPFSPSRLLLVEPVGYVHFLALQDRAKLVMTDSGGIQEETTFLGTPCLTLRSNTERPVTITSGTNVLVGNDLDMLRRECDRILATPRRPHTPPPLWDGRAAERITEVLNAYPACGSKAAAGTRAG